MSELAAPLTLNEGARVGLAGLERQYLQLQVLQARFRLSVEGWAREGFDFGDRDFACDEFALAFAESPGTAQRWIENAQMFADYPTIVARIGLPPGEGAGRSGTLTLR